MNTKTQQYLFNKLPDTWKQKILVTDEGCWLWQGQLNPTGYGRGWLYGLRHTVHRMVYKLLKDDLGSELVLDHICKNRHCCNPTHVSPVTQKQNTHRGDAKLFGRHLHPQTYK